MKFENTKLIFHYNKKHNEDTTVAPWVIKTKGQTFYIWHFESVKPFSTKETPDNTSTKGSFAFKGDLTIFEVDGKLQAKLTLWRNLLPFYEKAMKKDAGGYSFIPKRSPWVEVLWLCYSLFYYL